MHYYAWKVSDSLGSIKAKLRLLRSTVTVIPEIQMTPEKDRIMEEVCNLLDESESSLDLARLKLAELLPNYPKVP